MKLLIGIVTLGLLSAGFAAAAPADRYLFQGETFEGASFNIWLTEQEIAQGWFRIEDHPGEIDHTGTGIITTFTCVPAGTCSNGNHVRGSFASHGFLSLTAGQGAAVSVLNGGPPNIRVFACQNTLAAACLPGAGTFPPAGVPFEHSCVGAFSSAAVLCMLMHN